MAGIAMGAFAEGFGASRDRRIEREEMDRRRAEAEAAMANGQMPPNAVSLARGAVPPGAAVPPPSRSAVYGPDATLDGLIRATEGAGDYSTLFGHAQREGGRFAGVDVSTMTLDQLAEFTNPSGEYGQWVKSVNPRREVATPLGYYQIVGSTLRGAAGELGLPGNTVFDGNTQTRLFHHLAGRRLAGARTPEARRAALRSEWHGFRNVPDAILDTAIANYLNPPQQVASAAPMGAIRPGGPS
jgi:hypothetical protein